MGSDVKAEKSSSDPNSLGMDLEGLHGFPRIYASQSRAWSFISKIPELVHSYFLSFLYTSECFREDRRPGVHMVAKYCSDLW